MNWMLDCNKKAPILNRTVLFYLLIGCYIVLVWVEVLLTAILLQDGEMGRWGDGEMRRSRILNRLISKYNHPPPGNLAGFHSLEGGGQFSKGVAIGDQGVEV